jgi:hypothetical protein
MRSIVPEFVSTWLAREIDAAPLDAFRRAFALVWIAYDSFDLWLSGTAVCAWWATTTVQGAPLGLQLLQVGLIVCQCVLWMGRYTAVMAAAACCLRVTEQLVYFGLNDFLYYIVTAAWLAVAAGFTTRSAQGRVVPAWLRDGMVVQAGWIYFASALMKMNPVFLSGDHFWVRHAYQTMVVHWPYPEFMRPWLLSLPVNAGLARLTVAAEASLGVLLCLRRGRPLALALALGIHVFAAIAMNVFFFGASLIAQVWLLFPREQPAQGSARPLAGTSDDHASVPTVV